MNEGAHHAEVFDIGDAVRPIRGETDCGDAALVVAAGCGIVFALVGGLGHGAAAADAAARCVESIGENAQRDLPAIFAAAHDRLRGGRGAVAAIGRVFPATREAELAAIGNVGISWARGERTHGLSAAVSVPGVLGSAFHRVRPQRVDLEPGDLVVLHTDGIRGRIDALPLRLLPARDAAAEVVAAHGAEDDDAGCIVVRALTAGERAPRSTPAAGRAASSGVVQMRLSLLCEGDAQIAAFEARRFGARIGLGGRAQWEVGIAAAELATNAFKHGVEGVLTLRHAQEPEEAMIIEVADRGEGIPDDARGPGAGVMLRRPGEGLGVGLGSVHRLMDEVEVYSVPGQGTRVVARKRIVI